MEIPPSFENRHPSDEDRRKEMAGLTVAGLIPPRVQGQIDDDSHREEL